MAKNSTDSRNPWEGVRGDGHTDWYLGTPYDGSVGARSNVYDLPESFPGSPARRVHDYPYSDEIDPYPYSGSNSVWDELKAIFSGKNSYKKERWRGEG